MDLKNSLVYGLAGLNGERVSDFQEAEKVATEIAGKVMEKVKRQKKNSKKNKKSFP